jgi:hypothetical protein
MTVRELELLLGRPSTQAEQSELLWSMTRQQREQAMYRGELTIDQLCQWASTAPNEVPKLHGEFWFIAITDAELLD